MNKDQLALVLKYSKILSNDNRSFELSVKNLKVSIVSDFPTLPSNIIDDFLKLFLVVDVCLSIDIKRTVKKIKHFCSEEITDHFIFKTSISDLQKHKNKYADFCMFLVDYSLDALQAIAKERQEDA
jgi:hypothetical protein